MAPAMRRPSNDDAFSLTAALDFIDGNMTALDTKAKQMQALDNLISTQKRAKEKLVYPKKPYEYDHDADTLWKLLADKVQRWTSDEDYDDEDDMMNKFFSRGRGMIKEQALDLVEKVMDEIRSAKKKATEQSTGDADSPGMKTRGGKRGRDDKIDETARQDPPKKHKKEKKEKKEKKDGMDKKRDAMKKAPERGTQNLETKAPAQTKDATTGAHLVAPENETDAPKPGVSEGREERPPPISQSKTPAVVKETSIIPQPEHSERQPAPPRSTAPELRQEPPAAAQEPHPPHILDLPSLSAAIQQIDTSIITLVDKVLTENKDLQASLDWNPAAKLETFYAQILSNDTLHWRATSTALVLQPAIYGKYFLQALIWRFITTAILETKEGRMSTLQILMDHSNPSHVFLQAALQEHHINLDEICNQALKAQLQNPDFVQANLELVANDLAWEFIHIISPHLHQLDKALLVPNWQQSIGSNLRAVFLNAMLFKAKVTMTPGQYEYLWVAYDQPIRLETMERNRGHAGGPADGSSGELVALTIRPGVQRVDAGNMVVKAVVATWDGVEEGQ